MPIMAQKKCVKNRLCRCKGGLLYKIKSPTREKVGDFCIVKLCVRVEVIDQTCNVFENCGNIVKGESFVAKHSGV